MTVRQRYQVALGKAQRLGHGSGFADEVSMPGKEVRDDLLVFRGTNGAGGVNHAPILPSVPRGSLEQLALQSWKGFHPARL